MYHPIRDYAIFSGNRSDDSDNTLRLSGTGVDADVVNGKIYVNGDVAITESSAVNGSVEATESVFGGPPTGGAIEDAPRIKSVDLNKMDYPNTADFVVDASSPFNGSGRLPSTDPRHIIVKSFRNDLGPAGYTLNNPNYFLGDPYENSDLSRISVPAAGNNKVYFVDGNLWIEPQGQTLSIVKTPADGTKITIVARGNIYFADELLYQKPDKDALMFIALTDGESFRDLDGDNQYDVGEPILHDNGNGVYEGPIEGSGNIFFGDPNGGPIGHVHAFMYADNFFDDHSLTDGGEPLPFEVTGFMSAGEQVQIKRDLEGVTYYRNRSGGGDDDDDDHDDDDDDDREYYETFTSTGHARMIVNFDDRIAVGNMPVPGFPESRTSGKFSRVFWRVVSPETN
jgi:hypothetical protein